MSQNEKTILQKVNSASVVQQIIDSLTDAMIRRQFKPGDRIPTETELAGMLGVGRNSVREAVKILVAMGVLEIRRAEGTFVREGFSETMIDPMVYGVILNTGNSYDELLELREVLFTGAVRIAAAKSSESAVSVLKEHLDVYRQEIVKGPGNVEAIFAADNDFYDAVAAMGANMTVDKLCRVVRILTHTMRRHAVENMLRTGRSSELYKLHEKLFHIISDGELDELNETCRSVCRLGRR